MENINFYLLALGLVCIFAAFFLYSRIRTSVDVHQNVVAHRAAADDPGVREEALERLRRLSWYTAIPAVLGLAGLLMLFFSFN